MAEKHHSPHHGHEHHKSREHHEAASEHQEHVRNHHEAPDGRQEAEKQLDLESIQKSIEAHAKSSAETSAHHHETEHHQNRPLYVNNELKKLSYQRTMTRVRKSLSPVERSFSKLIHQPVVNSVSELGAKTVARPPALLGGGVFALIGSFGYFWACKHYGYEYNFSVFLILVTSGFLAGLILEAAARLTSRR